MANTGIDKRGVRGLADINHGPLRAVLNRSTSVHVTARDSGDANDIQTTNAITSVIDGRPQTASALSGTNATITAADDESTSQAAGTTCYYVFCIDAADAVTCYKGVDDVAAYPAIPSTGVAPFAVAKVVNASASAWTLGTDDYNAASVTTTFNDVAHVPAAVI